MHPITTPNPLHFCRQCSSRHHLLRFHTQPSNHRHFPILPFAFLLWGSGSFTWTSPSTNTNLEAKDVHCCGHWGIVCEGVWQRQRTKPPEKTRWVLTCLVCSEYFYAKVFFTSGFSYSEVIYVLRMASSGRLCIYFRIPISRTHLTLLNMYIQNA